MSDAASRRATYEDVLSLPDHLQGEIIDGELIVSPRPRPKHLLASTWMGAQLVMAYGHEPDEPDGPGGWWILDEPELHLDEYLLIPDIAGWRRERLPELPDDDEAAFITVAPDWVCEVLSPSTARTDRLTKKPAYAAQGIGHLWFVDPANRTLEILKLDGDVYREIEVFQGDARVRAAPFEEVELNLSRGWRTRGAARQ
jgi:Uma2 family endonuclease